MWLQAFFHWLSSLTMALNANWEANWVINSGNNTNDSADAGVSCFCFLNLFPHFILNKCPKSLLQVFRFRWMDGATYRSWPPSPGTSWALWRRCRQTGWKAGSGCWWTGTASAKRPWRPPCWPGPSAGGLPTTEPRPGPRLSPTAPRCCPPTGPATSRLAGEEGRGQR